MIKLIASDLDGTLANADGSIPEDIFSCAKELEDKGIQFVVATGRQGITVYESFKPIMDSIYLIADNGAIVFHKGEVMSVTELNQKRAHELINELAKFPDLDAIICCEKTAYSHNASDILKGLVKTYYKELTYISDTNDIKEPILKIAVFGSNGITKKEEEWLRTNYGDVFLVTVSGAQWVDLGSLDVSKGIALEKIMKECNVNREEAMAFGDYFNDESMLKAVEESYAMENAPEEMKHHAKHIAPTGSVIEIIREKVLNG